MLDRIDAEIISLLQNDGRISNKQIAARTGLAPSSVHDRLKRLWQDGVLTSAHVEVDARLLGVGLEALLMIELSKHERSTLDGFINDLLQVPEVRTAHLITGRYDLVVHVVARDTRHLKDLALEHFTSRACVVRIETSIIYESWRRHEVPLLLPLPAN